MGRHSASRSQWLYDLRRRPSETGIAGSSAAEGIGVRLQFLVLCVCVCVCVCVCMEVAASSLIQRNVCAFVHV